MSLPVPFRVNGDRCSNLDVRQGNRPKRRLHLVGVENRSSSLNGASMPWLAKSPPWPVEISVILCSASLPMS